MKVAYISTSLPTTCGIATFNQNLFTAINQHQDIDADSFVVALSDADDKHKIKYPNEVKFVIRQQQRGDYLNAAAFINGSGADVCIIEHEFGIYGGESGLHVLALMSLIQIPITTILHTVLKQPTYVQQTIIQQIGKKSTNIVVMSIKAIGFLTTIYNVAKAKINYIEHGVPNLTAVNPSPIKQNEPFKGKKTLLTFGLISRNKGLETVIKALPKIIVHHPDVCYVVLGNTHPGVLKHAGEEYRDSLKALANELNVGSHLIFVNQFLNEQELHQYLYTTDIYVTPYLNEAQITSGTLSYAVGAGAAVISTPYWHAQELLSKQRGLLFDFNNSNQLALLVIDLFDNPEKLNSLKENAYEYGLRLRWPKIGKEYVDLLHRSLNNHHVSTNSSVAVIDMANIPPFDLTHIKKLTDNTGIIQHAKYGIPNLKEGYCLDDNARALILCLLAYEEHKNKEALDLLPIYLSYIQFMQTDDGNFRNFLSFSRKYLDEVGSEDSFGRTMWALGYLVSAAPNNSYKEFAKELFLKSVPHVSKLTHLRGIANTIIGLSFFLRENPSNISVQQALATLAKPLIEAFELNSNNSWQWFETKMTYDNALLPLALLFHYQTTKNESSLNIAMKSLNFLTEKTMALGYLNPVGNDGWLEKNSEMAIYDQQAIETMAMVLVYFKSYEITNDTKYLHYLHQSYQWFIGENSLNLPLYDDETKGCADGLQPNGVNRNQGAESTIAYLISHLVFVKAIEIDFKRITQSSFFDINILN